MLLEGPRTPLRLCEVAIPEPRAGEALIKVEACAVCRTDLHILDGELAQIPYPLIPGHQIVGEVVASRTLSKGSRVGVPWLGRTCGNCAYCETAQENLCDQAEFTGYTRPGGYAEYLAADERFCFPVAKKHAAVEVAPLLCAGLIGYRALRLCGEAERIGLFGFGAAAHQLAQVLRYQGREFYAFSRAGDLETQQLASELGASWAGGSDEQAPKPLDAAIIFAPVGALVPTCLRAVRKGGRVICAGIHMSDIPAFPYSILWGERRVQSVANLTREDGLQFLELARQVPIKTAVTRYPLEAANQALADLRAGVFAGSAVLELVRPPGGRTKAR